MSVEAQNAVKANHTTAKAQERFILLLMASYNTSKRSPYYVYPGLATIASDANMSIRQVSTWIKRLCDGGFLFAVRKGPHPNGYFILLSPEGNKLDRNTDFQSFVVDTGDRNTDFHSRGPKIGSLGQKIGSTSQNVVKCSASLIRNEREEKEEEKESPSPLSPHTQNGSQKPQPDRMSMERWRQLCDRVAQQLTPFMARELRRARLELYEESSDALVILPSDSADAADLYATRFMEHILLHLPDVTRHRGWRVVIWTEAELAAAEQEIHA